MRWHIPFERLPDVVLGKDPEFPRSEAIAQLAASDLPDREALLGEVLEKPGEQRRYRAVAAIALGRIATSRAETILLRKLVKTEEDAFSEILLSLGRIGGPGALAAIDALNLHPQHAASAMAAYATTLIAHRLGLPGHELPFPPAANLLKPATTQVRPIEFTPLPPAAVADVLDGMKRHPYGIGFDPSKLTRIQCAGETSVVCPNREFLGGAAERLKQRKGILALCAMESQETGDYSVSYVVLARPTSADGAIEITAHRCSGTLALAGVGTVEDARVEFELRSVRRPGARAIAVNGAMVDGRIEIAQAVSSTTREKSRETARLVV